MSRILLAEDNQLNREMLSRRLTREGHEVLIATNGVEALKVAQTLAPDLVLMDMSMPVMNGWEATRQLKAAPATRSIPIIALTAHALVGDREKALQAGCDDYEVKPIDFARLFGKVKKLVAGTNAPTPRTGPALLVVDDNEMNREVVARRLEREGCVVTLARSAAEALDLLKQRTFDLVLLDVMMPEVNGLDILRVIRRSHSIAALPVIMLTAKDQSEDVVAALQQGASDYVTKPINFPVLIARIRTHLAIKEDHGRSAPPAARPVEAPVPQPAPPPPAFAPRRPGPPGRSAAAGLPTGAEAGRFAAPIPSGKARVVGRQAPTRRGSGTTGAATAVADAPAAVSAPTIPGYEILKEVGRGGMGIVFQARHVRMNRVVALKVIDKKHLPHPDRVERFYQEIQAAAQLTHRNVVLAYDAGQWADTHYFAMEYVEGIDLNQLVKQRGPLPVEEVCDYICQTARGLQHIHERGLVHRDIKPSNLLITQTPLAGQSQQSAKETTRSGILSRATVKILDLGLALLHQPPTEAGVAAGLTRDGRVVGTADYMAPEQWMNAHKVDIRADLYSLGCTLYLLLAGQVPFPTDEPMEKMLKHHLEEPVPLPQLRPNLPGKLVEVVRRLMAKKPALRYQEPAEVAEALRPFLPGQTVVDL